jgi:hypothetical protein
MHLKTSKTLLELQVQIVLFYFKTAKSRVLKKKTILKSQNVVLTLQSRRTKQRV